MYGNHFSFKELTTTNTGCPNYPLTDEHCSNLARLWQYLNHIREEFDRPIFINSAYRTPQVNKQVGGAKRSKHMQGRAADIRTAPLYMDELCKLLESHKHELAEYIVYPTFFHIAL